MPRRLTTEEFIEKAIKKHKTCKDKDEYDYSLVNYINGYTEVKIIHKTCGKIFEQKPSNHLDGCGCQYCYGTPKKTTEQFIEDAKKVHGNKFDYSKVDYVDCKTKVKIICNECKRVFEQTPNSHLNGDGCSWCAPNKKLTREEFIEKSKQAHGDRYDYKFVNYINRDINVKIRCKEHGIFEQTPNNHMNGHGCKYCRMDLLREKFALTTEEFIKRAKQAHGDRYDYSLVNYINSKTKVKIICPEHGVFEQMPDNHCNGAKCPCCQYFKGEQRIADYLSSKNIENIYEHKYPDLKDKELLSYDFYIEKYNLLIEFNGRQHYEFVSYFHKDLHDFHRQLHHDWLKRKYAREHNIELLVIPYWDFDNIEKILEQTILEKEIKESSLGVGMTTKELFDLNLKEIKINKKIKIKYINTLEEQIESGFLLEKLTQEQKKKSAEEVSKFYLEPIRVLKVFLDKKWNKKITEEEIKQKRLEYLRYKTIVKKLIDEFKEVGDEEDLKEFVKSITGITNGWIVRTDDGFKVMPPIYGKEIPIIKVPTYSKKLGSFDFEFNKKADKKDIANLSYRHELGHIFNYLKQYIETGKGDIVGTIDALKNGEYEKLVDSEGKANAYAVDNMNRFKRRELLKNSELSNEKAQIPKNKFEEGNIEKLSQLYQAGTEKYSEKIKNTLKGAGK